MKKQVSLWVVALLLTICGFYGIGVAFHIDDWMPAAWGALILVGCVGLVFRQKWSQYVVYVFLLALIVSWGNGVWQVAESGWPYPDVLSSIIALSPGVLLVVFCGGCGFVVYRYFR